MWCILHIWELKVTYINYIDCTHHKCTNDCTQMYTSQHGHDGEETIQPLWKQSAPQDG